MRVTWFEPGTLEAPAAVRSGTPRARERQRTPRGDAQDAQARGADAPSARAREVVEEAGGDGKPGNTELDIFSTAGLKPSLADLDNMFEDSDNDMGCVPTPPASV